MTHLAEAIPPTMAIVGSLFMRCIATNHKWRKAIVRDYPLANKEDTSGLEVHLAAVAEGWQVMVDLLYSLLALIAIPLCRLVVHEIQDVALVPVVMALIVLDVFFLVKCADIGRVDTATSRIKFLRMRPTWKQLVEWYVYVSNLGLIAVFLFESRSELFAGN